MLIHPAIGQSLFLNMMQKQKVKVPLPTFRTQLFTQLTPNHGDCRPIVIYSTDTSNMLVGSTSSPLMKNETIYAGSILSAICICPYSTILTKLAASCRKIYSLVESKLIVISA